MYIIIIEGYYWNEIVIIALETEKDVHFETIFFVAKMTLIVKR